MLIVGAGLVMVDFVLFCSYGLVILAFLLFVVMVLLWLLYCCLMTGLVMDTSS